MGELRTVISSNGIGLINIQYRIARKAMPTGKNPVLGTLPECNDGCSVSIELEVSCCHMTYLELGSATAFTRWEVPPRWRLREPSPRDHTEAFSTLCIIRRRFAVESWCDRVNPMYYSQEVRS